MKRLIILLLLGGWIAAVISISKAQQNDSFVDRSSTEVAYSQDVSAERDRAQGERNDPSLAPQLSPHQQNPDWSIRKWLGVGRKSSDCEMADEMMDRNATVKIIRRRGSGKEYYLADYISSCRNFSEQMFHEIVEPQASKWCLYRETNARLEELCSEWLNNKSVYLDELRASAAPTIARYKEFSGQ